MQASPEAQVDWHLGPSSLSSHSLQVSALILTMPPFSKIELVGQTGIQSPQLLHSATTIFIAMMFSLI
jgi:hypothetical protein